MTWLLMVTYALDSAVAMLVLDGELWEREPYTLVGHHEDVPSAPKQHVVARIGGEI